MRTLKLSSLALCILAAPALIAWLLFSDHMQQVHAQAVNQQTYGYIPTTTLPAVLTANIVGQSGQGVAYYTLIVNSPAGSVPSEIIQVNNVPNTLNSTNYVSFTWQPVTGAATFDLLKLTSASYPSGSSSVLLHGALSSTTYNSVDQGTSLTSYTLAAQPPNITGTAILNNRGNETPMFEFVGKSGSFKAGLKFNGAIMVASPVTTNTGIGSITIPANVLVNGLYTHSPTGTATDTTDTATNIINVLPTCIVNPNGLYQTNFFFSLFNTGSATITVAGGTGVTIVGTATVTASDVRNFVGVVTTCPTTGTPAVSLYSIGTGAY